MQFRDKFWDASFELFSSSSVSSQGANDDDDEDEDELEGAVSDECDLQYTTPAQGWKRYGRQLRANRISVSANDKVDVPRAHASKGKRRYDDDDEEDDEEENSSSYSSSSSERLPPGVRTLLKKRYQDKVREGMQAEDREDLPAALRSYRAAKQIGEDLQASSAHARFAERKIAQLEQQLPPSSPHHDDYPPPPSPLPPVQEEREFSPPPPPPPPTPPPVFPARSAREIFEEYAGPKLLEKYPDLLEQRPPEDLQRALASLWSRQSKQDKQRFEDAAASDAVRARSHLALTEENRFPWQSNKKKQKKK